jgi:polysaccharide biosynthesis transport protein
MRDAAGLGVFGGHSDVIGLFRSLLGLLVKHVWVLVVSLLACIVVAVLATLLTTPLYRASGTIQIEPDQTRIATVDQVTESSNVNDSLAFYQTQYGVLRSRTQAERVVAHLGVAQLVQADQELTPNEAREAATKRILESVTIRPVTGSRLVTIEYSDPSSELAAAVVNAYVDTFIEGTLQRRFEASSYARDFLQTRLNNLRTRIEDTERQLVTYAEEADLVVANGGVSDAGTNSALTALVDARTKATQTRIEAEEALTALRRGADNLPELINNTALQNLKIELNKARSDLAEKRAVFGPDYPVVRQIAARIAGLEREERAMVGQIIGSVIGSAEARVAAATEVAAKIEREIAETRALSRSADRRAIDYNILRRELDTNKALYDGLLQRYREIGIAGGVGLNNVSVVDRATVPKRPIAPRPIINIALGILGGFGLAVLIILVLENWAQAIRNPKQAEKITGLPLLGVIPKFEGEGRPIRTLILDNRAPVTEAYHSVRASLQFATGDGALPRSILVTSARAAEGKSTTAVAIATIFARTGLRVVLVDADLRRPSIQKTFSVPNNIGMAQFLGGESSIDEVLRPTSEEGLFLVTSGRLPANPAGLFLTPIAAQMFKSLAERFDLVVVDGPPVLGLADAPVLASLVEVTIFNVAANYSSQQVITRAIERVRLSHARLVGVLLTKFDAKRESYDGSDYEASYGGYAYEYGVSAETAKKTD